MKLKIFMNKKGDVWWWFTRVIMPLVIFAIILYMIRVATGKGIYPYIQSIFKRW